MTTPTLGAPGASGRPSDATLYVQTATTLVRIGTQILDWDRAADRVEIQRRQTQMQMQINQARADVASGQRAADLAYNELLIVQRYILLQISDAQAESLRRAALTSSGPPPQPDKPKVPVWAYALGGVTVVALLGGALVVSARSSAARLPARPNPKSGQRLYAMRRADAERISIRLYVDSAAQYGTHIAKLTADRLHPLSRITNERCAESLEALVGFRPRTSSRPYVVNDTEVHEDWQRRELGTWLYAEAAQMAWKTSKAAIVADLCGGGSTSGPARDVWRGRLLKERVFVEGFAALADPDNENPAPTGLSIQALSE